MFKKIKNILKQKSSTTGLIAHLWESLQNEEFEEVILGAKPYLNNKAASLAKDAAKLTGLALFRQSKYQEALPFFQKATIASATVSDWFNVVTSATLSLEVDIGRTALDEAIRLQINSDYKEQPSIPFMRQYYACALRDIGEFKLALDQINELRKIYEELRITDSHFVYVRGVPFLSHTIEVAIDVFNGLGEKFDGIEWINNFSINLDEEGKQYLSEVKEKLKVI